MFACERSPEASRNIHFTARLTNPDHVEYNKDDVHYVGIVYSPLRLELHNSSCVVPFFYSWFCTEEMNTKKADATRFVLVLAMNYHHNFVSPIVNQLVPTFVVCGLSCLVF